MSSVNKTNTHSDLARIRAQQEAKRKAEEEAKRKAEAEAKRKAEEAAKKKAEEEAKKKAEEATKKKAAEEAKKADKAEQPTQKGAAEDLADKGMKKAIKKPAEPIAPDEAKVQHKAIQEDVKKAKTPEDVSKVAKKSKDLQERLKVTEDPRIDKEMRKEISKTDDDLQKAAKAVKKIEDSKKKLEGSPEDKAAETARLLSNPDEIEGAIKDLKALKDSPVAETVTKDVKAIAEKADSKGLAEQFSKEPDLAKYPPEMAGNLAKLSQVNDPKLQQSLTKVATEALNKKGGLSLEDIKKNPGVGQLLAPLQNSSDPAVKAKLADTVKGWANESIAKNLEGKEKKAGVDEAMKGFKSDMKDLAKKTGLGEAIQSAAPKAIEDSKKQIAETAEKGSSFFDKAGDFFGDAFGGVIDAVDATTNFVGDAVGFVGEVAGKAVDLLGDGVDFVADTAGKVQGGAIKLAGNVVGEGLEALGAEDAAKLVKDSSQKAGDMVEEAADKIGDVTDSFVDGVGGAIKGTTDGLQFMIKEPTEAAKGIYAIGKAVVTGDTDTLKAMGKALTDEAFINPKTGKFDIAYGTGYIAANVVPMLVTGGSSTAASGANATSKLAKVSNFASRADQVLDVARAVGNADFTTAINSVKAIKAPLAAADDVARLGRTKAFLKNPAQYAKNYANHIKGNVKVAQGQAKLNLKGLKEGATNIMRDPKGAVGDFATQLGKDAKKTQLTGKLAFKSAVKGLKTRDMAQFQKAVDFMNRNPLVQGINQGITRTTGIMDNIAHPLKPITSRIEGAVNANFDAFTGVGKRASEATFDTIQTAAQQEELAKK